MTKRSLADEQQDQPGHRSLSPSGCRLPVPAPTNGRGRADNQLRATALLVVLALTASSVLLWSPVHAAGPPSSATPAATPSPTPTTTPTPRPPGARSLLIRSAAAMGKARQVHTYAVFSDGKKALAKGIRVVADCDLQSERERIHLEPITPGTGQFVDWILSSGAAWYRSSQDPTWQQDTQSNVDVLIPILPITCPIGQGQYEPFAAKGVVLRNRGAAVVDGLPTWHIQIRSVRRKTRLSFSYYVDQSSFRWDRVVIDQEAPKPKYYADAHYSAYDQPVSIPTPVSGTGG